MKPIVPACLLVLAACATPLPTGQRDGLVEFLGSQRTIFETGKADRTFTVASMAAGDDAYGVGAAEGLDGEVTVLRGRSYVTRVKGGDFALTHGTADGVIFGVWTRQREWRAEPVPSTVSSYVDLQAFVKARAAVAGLDASKPFPFLLEGAPASVTWHINVDRTDGKPVTRELFAKSKETYVARGEAMEIVGFHSEKHPGVFISALAPAIKPGSGTSNALHMHLVSKTTKAAGHIDDLVLGPGMTLKLPAP